MKLSDILMPTAIKVVSSVSSKKRLLHSLAEVMETAHGLPADKTLEALMEREALGPTGVGKGVALPHARLEELDQVVGAFILLEKTVDFESVDRQPVDLVFGLLAPVEAGVEHLKSLALVSRNLRSSAMCSKLRANPDASTLYTILTAAEADQAA